VPANWTAVGNAITARLDEIGMQQKDLAARSNVSVATIREIQAGKERRRNPRILRDISVRLGCPANHLEDLLHGRQPDEQPHETQSHETRAPADEPAASAFLAKLAFILEHRVGRVVDVIYNNDSDVDITIEIRHSTREP
jgi:transcriptional regulator with XRE-family HTH domain